MNKRNFYKNCFFSLIACFIFCGVIASTALSAEEKSKNPIDCQGDKVEYIKEEKKVVGTGNVVVVYEGVRLTADKIIIYMDTQDALAYGKATLCKDNNVFCGENLSYNFGTKKGSIIDSMFEAPPWYGQGKKMDKIGDETVLYRKGYFTTCDKEKPHYRMVSNKIKIYLGDRLVANNVVFFVGPVPLLYIPRYSHPLNDDRPRVTILPGKKKQWGVFVLSAWRYYFNENARGVIRLDWREFMGVAGGFDYNYKIDDYGQGELKFYYMQERDRRIDEGIHAERQRYSIDYKHEWDIDKDTRLFGEYHRYGEPDFRYDYFYEAYKKEEQPETQISFTH
ncbi:MAG: LPS-assembly protein LptD, partial [Candidatus Omnitrophica bacterium]|nr:LPS-assembly protein LptD [Candidatus Omnitrophota bacterium]